MKEVVASVTISFAVPDEYDPDDVANELSGEEVTVLMPMNAIMYGCEPEYISFLDSVDVMEY